jgi:hypothetical protein
MAQGRETGNPLGTIPMATDFKPLPGDSERGLLLLGG